MKINIRNDLETRFKVVRGTVTYQRCDTQCTRNTTTTQQYRELLYLSTGPVLLLGPTPISHSTVTGKLNYLLYLQEFLQRVQDHVNGGRKYMLSGGYNGDIFVFFYFFDSVFYCPIFGEAVHIVASVSCS